MTLALLLFADASAVPLNAARDDLPLTGRLLGIGLPLSIIGRNRSAPVGVPEPAAGIGRRDRGQPCSDRRRPERFRDRRRATTHRVRRVLNVESGLNDGIATPVVTICIAAATVLGIAQHEFDSGYGAIGELAVGVVIGAGVGIVGGLIIGSLQAEVGPSTARVASQRWRLR